MHRMDGQDGCKKVPTPTPPRSGTGGGDRALLHVDEKVALKDVFALLVLLGGLRCVVVFPPKRGPTLYTVYVPHYMMTRSHLSFGGLAFDDVDNAVKEIRPAVLTGESPGHH